MRVAQPVLERLHRDLEELPAAAADFQLPPSPDGVPPMRLREKLELVDVHYAYPNAERTALNGLSLAVPARSTVGIVGGTGAGKTTAVDLVLGLLEPQAGEIRVDGVPVTRRTAAPGRTTSATCRSRSS